MEEKKVLKKAINIKILSQIISNKELSINDKLVLSVDYTFSLKNGYNILTNIKVGELLCLHPNIISNCRIRLIKKGYLVKDDCDKRIYRLTDKLDNVDIPLINGKKDMRTVILPFEIYNHPHLQSGAKLLFAEYNSMRNTEKGYFAKRETSSQRLNVSKGSITNWTKELDLYGLLDEYTIESGFYTKQRNVRTKEFARDLEKPIYDFEDLFEDDSKQNIYIKQEEIYMPLRPVEKASDLYTKERKSISEDSDLKKKDFKKQDGQKENLWDSPSLPLGGIKKFSDLHIEKKGKKNKLKNKSDEDCDFEKL